MTQPGHIAKKLAVAGALTVGVELAAAVLWPAPDQPEHDASGLFGDSSDVLRVAGLGDSTLTAPGVTTADDIWIRVIARRLATSLERTVDLRSYATGGATSGEVVADQLENAVEFEPHLAFVSVGANDVIRGMSMRRLESNLETIVERLSKAGARVVTSGVGDLGSIPRLAPPLRQLATRMGRRADRIHDRVTSKYGAIKVDQWTWSREEFNSRRDIWSPDWFHPNASGHMIWADVCWETLELAGPQQP